jgi:alcohol dehydrogenase class IV
MTAIENTYFLISVINSFHEINTMNLEFNFSRIPKILFGAGKLKQLPDLILGYGPNVILLTGSRSFKNSERYNILIKSFEKKKIAHFNYEIGSEPTPEQINSICEEHRKSVIDVVVAVGGGSVLDAGKAVSAMLEKTDPVETYLEGVGTKIHDGSKKPFFAVPTTAGTGSEATKNAVITELGENGFKKSLRHDNFVPDVALIDPELTFTCPPRVTAACGMDAFTQLLESYVSSKASPLTDALAYSGINLIKDNLIKSVTEGAEDIEVRSAMSYGALLSGITLANAGLGIVHGLASPMGSFYDIPHGVVCGTLVGISTKINIDQLRKNESDNRSALKKYADIGKLLSGNTCRNDFQCCDHLIKILEEWTQSLKLPKLGDYGLRVDDIEKIIDGTGIKNNPAALGRSEIKEIILERI